MPRFVLARWLRVALAVSRTWMFVAAYGCTDSDSRPETRESSTTEQPEEDGGEAVHECQAKALGTPCGTGQFCVHERCVWNSCGDGVKADDEQCDDGNSRVGDGCDPDCRAEPRGCGNAKLEAGEECDDGNRIDVDVCSNACTRNLCGNRRLDPGEECDDGNQSDADGCSKFCTSVRCRNGRVDPGEECDDGDAIDDNGCTNKCKRMVCGDGARQEKEECDDGNTVDADGCSNRCRLNVCGNQRLDPGEECEQGTAGCDAHCKQQADLCTPCEQAHCRDYLAHDFYGGCYEDKPSQEDWLTPVHPGEISVPCKRVIECARKTMCRSSASVSFVDPCYCGKVESDADLERCRTNPLGPCKDEWFVAAGTSDPILVYQWYSQLNVPLGYAFWLLNCDAEFCRTECAPWIELFENRK